MFTKLYSPHLKIEYRSTHSTNHCRLQYVKNKGKRFGIGIVDGMILSYSLPSPLIILNIVEEQIIEL